MKYRDGIDYSLENVNFTIKSGTKVGVIGRTGAGKSSLLQALFRITEIEIESYMIIDNKNYKEIGLHELRKNISIIPQ